MSLPVTIIGDPIDAAGWAQFVGGILTIVGAWLIARRDHRITSQRLRDEESARTEALKALISECITAMQTLDSKASKGAFTRGNVGASEEDADGLVQALASVPLLALRPSEVPVIVNVRKHMTTARRRVGFIQDHLKAGTTPKGIGFSGLLRQLRAEAKRL